MGASALFLGIVLAVATSAFKPAVQNEKGFTVYTFAYSGPDYSITNVQDEAYWTYTPSSSLCDNTLEKACRIQATEDFVDLSGSMPVLDPAINIVASNGGTGKAYVLTIDDDHGTVSNSTD